jgi:hypothetical protein
MYCVLLYPRQIKYFIWHQYVSWQHYKHNYHYMLILAHFIYFRPYIYTFPALLTHFCYVSTQTYADAIFYLFCFAYNQYARFIIKNWLIVLILTSQ